MIFGVGSSLLSALAEITAVELKIDRSAVALAFGRYSLAFSRAHAEPQRLWSEVGDHPEVLLKRGLWDGLLRTGPTKPH